MTGTRKAAPAASAAGCGARLNLACAGTLAYVVFVLTLDTLIVMGSPPLGPWARYLAYRPHGFDVFKFVTWFALPFAMCLPWMDWGAFGTGRWRRGDWLLLGALVVLGIGAIALVPFVPALRSVYGGQAWFPGPAQHGLWLLSWLPGWEFMHRYFLVLTFARRWPKWGWLVAPVLEGAYHLQKPGLEMLGMIALSAILSWWTVRRRNVMLPFLAHLAIEVELMVFMYLR